MGKGRGMEKRIKEILNELNMNIKNKGYRCWIEAVKVAIKNKHKTCPMMTKLYPEVAQRLNNQTHRVERAMRHAYENNREEIQKYFTWKGQLNLYKNKKFERSFHQLVNYQYLIKLHHCLSIYSLHQVD